MSAVARIHGLERRFAGKEVLSGIDLDIEEGEFVALLGRSGSGKSTLLRAVAGLDHDSTGGGELRVTEDQSVVFQDARLLPWKRVIENVIFALPGENARERGRRALEDVELGGREQSWPHALSGGEQQRVALARSLARHPKLLLADEPFGALDALTRIRMHALLKRLSRLYRPAVLLVTHDVDEAIELADRVVVLENGRIGREIAIDLPEEPGARLARMTALRGTLLGFLGVTDAAPRPNLYAAT